MNIANDPEVNKVATAVKQVLLELQVYGSKHPADDVLESDLGKLIAAGALSPQSAAFIVDHQVRFLGFRPKPIKPDIPVLEVRLAARKLPLRFIGFRDGHVEVTEEQAQ